MSVKKVEIVRLDDGRIKIPLWFHTILRVDQSHLFRVNQGTRQLSPELAIEIVELFRSFGVYVHLLDLLPNLEGIKPYLCEPCPEA